MERMFGSRGSPPTPAQGKRHTGEWRTVPLGTTKCVQLCPGVACWRLLAMTKFPIQFMAKNPLQTNEQASKQKPEAEKKMQQDSQDQTIGGAAGLGYGRVAETR